MSYSSPKIQLNTKTGKDVGGGRCNTCALPGRKGNLLLKNIQWKVETGETGGN